MFRRTLAHPLLAAAALVACGDGATTPPDPTVPPDGVTIARSALARDTAPTVSDEDLATFRRDGAARTFDLYHAISADEPGNLAFSPHSIASALAMTWAGARGDTADELGNLLHFTLPEATQHAAFNATDLALASRGEGASGKDGQPFRLRVVNAAWAEATWTFLPAYLDLIAVNYGAGIFLVDFLTAHEAARATINAWIAEVTEDRIKDLLPEGSVSPNTRLVLTNAVYFNASWATQFDPDLTTDAPFFRADASQVSAPMMRMTDSFRFAAEDGWTAVELPYDGEEVAMLLVTTDGDFAAFDAGLDVSTLDAIDAALTRTEVALRMPRFEFRTTADLVPPLRALGIETLFTPGVADLSGLDGTRDLYVSGVLHEAFISLDETGTEAAAATAVIIGTTSAPPPPVPANFDKPFVWFIRDVPTGTILFAGRVTDPTAD
jgi:serpin B